MTQQMVLKAFTDAGEQIDLDAACKPTRVMGAPAEPPAVTGVISIVLLAMTFLTEGLLNGDIQFD
jgi:hypothetical protein